jgi:hypothetical protein
VLANQLLEQANSIIENAKPFATFEKFNEEDMNTNSDITYILAQYIEALVKFKIENIKYHSGRHYWILSDSENVKTSNPYTKR